MEHELGIGGGKQIDKKLKKKMQRENAKWSWNVGRWLPLYMEWIGKDLTDNTDLKEMRKQGYKYLEKEHSRHKKL